jgi:hypothetical protein
MSYRVSPASALCALAYVLMKIAAMRACINSWLRCLRGEFVGATCTYDLDALTRCSSRQATVHSRLDERIRSFGAQGKTIVRRIAPSCASADITTSITTSDDKREPRRRVLMATVCGRDVTQPFNEYCASFYAPDVTIEAGDFLAVLSIRGLLSWRDYACFLRAKRALHQLVVITNDLSELRFNAHDPIRLHGGMHMSMATDAKH